MKNTSFTTITDNTTNNTNTNTNTINKGEITMKKTNKKTRIIASVLSVIAAFSVAAFATGTASAADVTNTVAGMKTKVKKMPMYKFDEILKKIEAEEKAAEKRKVCEKEDKDFREGKTVVTADGKEKEFTDFAEAWTAAVAAKEAKIMVNSDLNGVENLKVPAGKKIFINFKRYTVKAKGNLFTVERGAELDIRRGTILDANTAVIANGNVKLDSVVINKSLDSAVKGGEGAKVVIDGCTFRDNRGKQGGAVYLPHHVDGTAITDSVFENNHAEREGGAVLTGHGVTGCTFRNNEAGTEGGAVYFIGNNETLSKSNFANNRSGSNGGAIAVTQECTNIKYCGFNDNQANGHGGAVYAPDERDLNMYGNTLVGNRANGNGGGIFTGYRARLVLSASRACDNYANGNGGAVYLGALRSKDHVFSDVTITGNEARTAGGVFADAGFVCAADVTVVGNVTIKGNTNDDLYLMKASGKKAMVNTDLRFKPHESCIFVNSPDKGEIAVVDLKQNWHEAGFRGNAGRGVHRGTFFNGTLYLE